MFLKIGGGVALDLSSSIRSFLFPQDGVPTAEGYTFLNEVSVGGALRGAAGCGVSAELVERRKRLRPRERGAWLAVGG